LDAFKPYVEQRYHEFDLSAVRLLEEIQPMGYAGSIRTLRRYLETLAPERRLAGATVRFETPPGAQGQVDWASCGHFVDAAGAKLPVYAFVMVLGYSRMAFVWFTASMDLPQLMRCHMEAFAFFGGWPKAILYDNMAQVRLNAGQLHPQFVDFANHYGFTIRTHRVRRPRTKGKVERFVSYLKDNFLNGRTFADHDDLNAQARHWLDNTCNVRVHETTGQRPIDLFAEEQLTPVSSVTPYQVYERIERKVGSEGFVRFDRSSYSVPPRHVGQKVFVEAYADHIVVRAGSLIIAEHERSKFAGACVADAEHVAAMWKLSLAQPAQARPHWQQVWQDSVAAVSLTSYEEVAQ
jgi:transposase